MLAVKKPVSYFAGHIFVCRLTSLRILKSDLIHTLESKEDETASDVRSQQFLQAQMAGLKLGANTVQKFVQKVAEREAVPGGGSVSALVGTLRAALGVMVGRLSSGCVAYQENEMKMRQLLPPLYDCLERSLELIDQDSDAFSQLMAANRNAPPLGIR